MTAKKDAPDPSVNNTDQPIEGYSLSVRLNIRKVVKLPGDNRFSNRGYGQDGALEIAEDLILGELDFVGLMTVLTELHKAVQAIRPETP